MKHKTNKATVQLDPEVLSYTSRRIKEMTAGMPTNYYNEQPTHPYIQRRLQEIKEETKKNSSEASWKNFDEVPGIRAT